MRGFTLIELMAAIAVLGTLTTIVAPRHKVFIARARQSEARLNLKAIQKLQKTYAKQSYFLANQATKYHSGLHYGIDKCGASASEAMNELGFRLEDCSKARYRYVTRGGNDCAKSDGSIAQGRVYPDCAADDEWHINIAGLPTL